MFVSSSLAVRRRLLAAAATAGLAAATVVAFAAPAAAAPTILYASPSGTGTACSSTQPCSLTAAQAAVRSSNDAMSDDIVVQLADGVYRLAAPLRLTADDSGSNGHAVVWQAAPSARPSTRPFATGDQPVRSLPSVRYRQKAFPWWHPFCDLLPATAV